MPVENDQPKLRRVLSHGVELVADALGPEQGQGVLLLHGGGQTRHAWRRTAKHLAELGYFVLAPDQRGHGDSAFAPDGKYTLEHFADDARAWGSQAAAPLVCVGASLGGLCLLLAAGEAPKLALRALALVDVAHRPEPVGVSRILEFMRAHPAGFASMEHAVSAVSDYLPQRQNRGTAEGLRRNLRERDGRLVWHWDPRLLDDADPNADREVMSRRLLAAANVISAPILLVRGASSDVVSSEIAEEFCRAVPHAKRVDVAGAQHMVAGDQNDPFLAAVLAFLPPP